MTVPQLAGLYHTGMVVNDLAEAMRSYSEAFGLRWAQPIPGSGMLHTRSGPLSRTDWFTYSLDGPHRIELLEQIDNTAWASIDGGPRLNHLGYFVDDLAAQAARLESLGFARELESRDANSTAYMSYHRDPNGGLFVELVDRASAAPALEPWWAGEGVGSFASRLAALGLDEETVGSAFEHRHTQTDFGRPT